MKSAFIDIGTNSIRLLIVDEDIELVRCKKEVITTRIGAGVDQNKRLSEKGMNDTVEALKQFVELLETDGIKACKVIATSAVRDSSNRDEFVTRVLNDTGLAVEVISGEEEAELGFLGLVEKRNPEETILAIDIGGGSTELILGSKEKIERGVSIDIGAVRLTDRFVTTDPIAESEIRDMLACIDEKIESQLASFNIDVIDCVIGIGGTITTMAAMKQEMTEYDRKAIHNSVVTVEDLKGIRKSLMSKTIKERQLIKGLQPKRADIILSGQLILERVMHRIGQTDIVISEFDNLEGAYFKNS